MAELYNFQKQSIKELLDGKHFIISGTGSGKTAIAVNWAIYKCRETRKTNILVITTASKSRTGDFEEELKTWFPLTHINMIVISWHKLSKWVNENWDMLGAYVVIFDEIQKGSAGVSSGMGRAFLKITKRNEDWAGFTATPGDNWLKFYPYLVACGEAWNKTQFMRDYATVQTFKGYPEIIGWRNEDKLRARWARMSYAPDTSKVMSELPAETHKVVKFNKPASYNKILKTHTNADGELLDTAGALCAELRRQCFTKEKQEWLKDFVEGLGTRAVFFYNFTKTGDIMTSVIAKSLPKGARVWRIDGKHHEIPTAETIGEKDVIICQWQSGSEALNLQHTHYWVSVEPHYSYSTSVQARGRIKRIGQENKMWFYYLKTPNTIEDAIYDTLKGKGTFAEDVWCAENSIDF